MKKYWTMLDNLEQFYEENVIDLQTYYRIKSDICDKMKENISKNSDLPF